jgi:hypothetical protein
MSASSTVSTRDAQRSSKAGPSAPPPFVDPHQVRQWLSHGEAMLIDVREPLEYAREHIEGAALLPLSRFDAARLAGREGAHHCPALPERATLAAGRPQSA